VLHVARDQRDVDGGHGLLGAHDQVDGLGHEQEAGHAELFDDDLIAIAGQDFARLHVGHEFRHAFIAGEDAPHLGQRRRHGAGGIHFVHMLAVVVARLTDTSSLGNSSLGACAIATVAAAPNNKNRRNRII
jgi:hypothetical protein